MAHPEIPEPPESGSTGTQVPTPEDASVLDATPAFQGILIAQAVEGLATKNSRNMGGGVGAMLLAGSFGQLTHDLDEARRTIRTKETELQRINDKQNSVATRVAVLEERLGSLTKSQRIRQVAVFSGTALFGIAIDLWKSALVTPAVLLAALGTVLLAFGAFSQPGGVK